MCIHNLFLKPKTPKADGAPSTPGSVASAPSTTGDSQTKNKKRKNKNKPTGDFQLPYSFHPRLMIIANFLTTGTAEKAQVKTAAIVATGKAKRKAVTDQVPVLS